TPAKGSKDYDLIFVVPKLKANEKATYEIISEDEAFDSPRYKWHDTPGKSTELSVGKTPVLRYMYEPLDDSTKDRRMETFKVFHHVFSPDGKELLTNWDIKQIFPHHRGLFYGFRVVTYDGDQHVDIWHCLKDTHQKQEKFEAIEAGTVLGRHRLEIAWNGNGKKTFATEHREVTAYKMPGGTMIDFVSRLVPTKGTVKLDGDPQHAGLHFRASSEVSSTTKAQTYYLRPDGKDAPGKTRNWDQNHPKTAESLKSIDLPWDAMSFVVGGKRYTTLYLDDPDNPKPARHSERDYGRFGSYFVSEATPEKPLTVRYRLWVQDGEITPERAAALYADFAEPPKAGMSK
ncbi:MAG: PmoA family protein, partial [Planctomycetia bacterium]|nr:PmoA family protein [Planctomycetia bacterium]